MLGEQLARFLGDLLIDRAQQHRQAFEHRHLGTEATPDAAHFQADHAGADDTELGWHCSQRQRTGIRQDQLFIELGARQCARGRSGGDDHVLGAERHAGGSADVELVDAGAGLTCEGSAAVEERDLVFLQQVQNAVIVLLDHAILALEHLRQVQLQAGDLDAVLDKAVAGMFEMLGRLQQRLRWNATDVGAGAAGSWTALGVDPVIDASDRKTQLRRADRRDVAAGAGADDDDVKLL